MNTTVTDSENDSTTGTTSATGGTGGNASGGTNGGATASSIGDDVDMMTELSMANQRGLSQDDIRRILGKDGLSSELAASLHEQQAANLGVAASEHRTGIELSPDNRPPQQTQEVPAAMPILEREPSPAEVIAAAKEKEMHRAFADGDNAFQGVERAHKVGQKLAGLTNEELTDISKSLRGFLTGQVHVCDSTCVAPANQKGLEPAVGVGAVRTYNA